jgi:hypothetical protein
MAFHPKGLVVDVVGIESSNRGRHCEVHPCCGSVLYLHAVVRFRAVQIVVDGEEQSALAVYWVADGDDRCRVGFLRRHLIKHKADYDGKLAQVIDMASGSETKEERAKNHRFRGLCRLLTGYRL